MKNLIFILTFLSSFLNAASAEINLSELEAKLKTDGLTGEIHGAVNDTSMYVLTYRNPKDFFENIQLPLTSLLPEVIATLGKIKRHQFYIVKGEFITNRAPVKHINITSLELSKDYSSDPDHMPYHYNGDVNELKNKTEFIGRVHAVGENGKMLVMEYKDRIIPVFVKETSSQVLTSALFRGDLVKVKFNVRNEPSAPTHLNLESTQVLPANVKPIELL